MLDNYIKQEKYYLNNESQGFVEAFPQLSQFLSESCLDPDVVRTLDGFTYLTSLLHAKLHREYPQLTTNLMDMLWPNYLLQTPSMAIIEFRVDGESGEDITPQATVMSEPTAEVPQSCTFNITRHTWVTPFTVTKSEKVSSSVIHITFSAGDLQNLQVAGIDKMRLFLGADLMSASHLYFWFSEYIARVTLVTEEHKISLPDFTMHGVGFDAADAILVYPRNTYAGYRLLHEYFSFTEGFLFLALSGLPDYLAQLNSQQFTLCFEFTRPLPETLKLTANSVKVNCAPTINLFYHDCEPIRLTGDKTEYPLYISHQQRDSIELFAIDSVMGWAQNQTRKYVHFDSFLHQTEYEKGAVPLYYYLNRRSAREPERIDYSLYFVRGDETKQQQHDEIISINALCSNGDEAQKLRMGDISRRGKHIPATVSLTNITFPSGVTRPSLNGSMQWTAISSLSLNYLSLLSKDALCQILQNYNFTARYNSRADKHLAKLLASIHRFESSAHQQYYRDLIIEGHKSTLEIAPDAFSSEGEMYLFGTVLAHFYSMYATVNSFHFLELVNSSTREVYQWPLMNA